ncbi:MAG TPA: ATP-binding cassette domain-containing protein [Polyangiaceae bacterium]|jgi:molybdate transport system ATP-binding protein|nr:ATP-binding cassette domain-containing protein [Polyangiaceae bacterium]
MKTFRIEFRGATLGPLDQPIFRDFSWTVEPFESWLITGPNGGGKSAIAQALAGGLEVTQGDTNTAQVLPAPDSVSLISFERQREVIFDERYHDDSEFADGGVDPGTAALDFVLRRKRGAPRPPEPARLRALAESLGILDLLARGLKYLSTGEIRKVLLCRELLEEPALLIFDEPYEGLDTKTRALLNREIERLVSDSVSRSTAGDSEPRTQVLIISDRYEQVPSGTTHVLYVDQRRVLFAGTRGEFEASDLRGRLAELGAAQSASLSQALGEALAETAGPPKEAKPSAAPLVELRNVRVSYSERAVLSGIDLTIRAGQHTLVRGPNGCGKTTLLNLINGDNPQVYANHVTVCGMKRGSGESIWDVKKQLGQVSYALHVDYAYQCRSNLIETVLSGFYDSIGLYREPSYAEIRAAERWLEIVGLLGKRAEPFLQLSYGEQRVALIARAVIKQPPLLILDEPCHGLDARHRGEVLTIADYIGENTASTILYVTHDPAEELGCTRQLFEFDAARGWVLSELGAARLRSD